MIKTIGAPAFLAVRFRDRDICLLGSGNSAALNSMWMTRRWLGAIAGADA